MKLPINEIICGAMPEATKGFLDNSVDAIVTDIPYGIGFMGKEWDTFSREYINKKLDYNNPKKGPRGRIGKHLGKDGSYRHRGCGKASEAGTYDLSRNAEYQEWCRVWSKECLRIAKPGAFLLCFGGTRTYHRVTCGLEDAGWQIRDCVMWLYGSGFPKSLNISKAIDKAKGTYKKGELSPNSRQSGASPSGCYGEGVQTKTIDEPQSSLARFWDGYGTALKPAWEPIIVAMKPLDGTFAHNAKKWGVAGLNIDEGRIQMSNTDADKSKNNWKPQGYELKNSVYNFGTKTVKTEQPQGRWPANLILDEEAAAMLDEQTGTRKSGFMAAGTKRLMSDNPNKNTYGKFNPDTVRNDTYGDSGGASRFFYCAKASRAERNAGLEGMAEKRSGSMIGCIDDGNFLTGSGNKREGKNQNHHPTVKPLKLMEYLCTLLKPPSEHPILLDPFCGSGTTLMAAFNTGWDYIGIDKEAEYVEIANKRVAWCKGQQPLFPVETKK